MSGEKDREEFRVVDKRRFTSEGETKGDQASGQGQGQRQGAASELPRREAPKDPGPTRSEGKASMRDPSEPLDFSSLIVSLATQALVLMGEVPNSDAIDTNLDAAKQTIDVIALLESKTKGNLSTEETKLITEVLSSLRLAFVNKVGKK